MKTAQFTFTRQIIGGGKEGFALLFNGGLSFGYQYADFDFEKALKHALIYFAEYKRNYDRKAKFDITWDDITIPLQ